MKYSSVFLGLGSNVGDREHYISEILLNFEGYSDLLIVKKSSIYETEPLYNRNQRYFLNLVVEVETNLNPFELIKYCKEVEVKLGRRFNTPKNSPREADIDILFFGDKIIDTGELTIPHPHLYERHFVLAPLYEIAPNFVCPLTGKTVSQLFAECKEKSRVVKYCREVI
jgi:2-amino-4-hydroxy-6-hydroxymethyldihydropteridine diphosphokinase